ncbi:MAG: HAMP domain-containing histidine kinase [Cyclobacteriaceae bacterium]|nr:HAMP domain-containing histidine kinase [Cyclobacteriaceae bacterium]MDH4294778.1 HAMP domain-containing histidine kinase [Cyclobacteriaceae bacterium]MDH5248627.1 HAMP domain-containing histidine kinase [Cyclobacteriaceae bacterium]
MRITLKTKIWFTVITIVLMFSFFSLFYFPAQQEKYLLNNYNNEVQNLANTISLGVRIALTEENFEGVQTAMSFVKDDPRLQFVSLLMTDTIWSSDHQRFSIKDSLLKTFPEKTESLISSESVIRKRSPFTTEMMSGAIELGLTTDQISIGKKEIRLTSMLVSGVFLVIGIIIGFWLARNISVPVLALRDAANKVGDGDLTQRVINDSGDEIGELATAFNKMVVDLGKAREELRHANLSLASTNDALHATVADLQAAQEQLVQAEKMASLGQLTAGIAHEINNPINFVTANIQPLKDDLDDILKIIGSYEKVVREKGMEKEFLEVEQFKQDAQIDFTMREVNDLLKGIEDGAMRTSEIVKGLRNFSRLDQNVFLKANLNESLESTLTLLHSSFKNRIQIVKDFGKIEEVECFPGKINQVFMNILSNAIQAIPGEGTVFIRTRQEGNLVKVSIKDTGAGMSEVVRKKIFDPFFTTKDVGKGTGLGLSISFGIIQKHHGEIEVFSNPGEGTEFVISLPVKQESEV